MSRWNLVLALSAGVLLAACGQPRAAERPADEPAVQKETPPAAAPEYTAPAARGTDMQPGIEPGVTAEPAPVERHQATSSRPAAPRSTATRSARTAQNDRAPHVTLRNEPPPAPRRPEAEHRPEPVERIGRDSDVDERDRADERFGTGSRDREIRPLEHVTLPAGTELTLVLESPVSSATSHDGDAVTARVERAVGEDGRVALPGGTVLRGRVVRVDEGGRVSGRARVAVDFDHITVRGESHRLETTEITAVAPDSHGRDAKIIGGGAAAGAVIGGILGGRKGIGKGILLGAGAGTAAVLTNKGQDVELPAGSRWVVRVQNAVRL
jgi:type IV secretory pathway VirB10-like protein